MLFIVLLLLVTFSTARENTLAIKARKIYTGTGQVIEKGALLVQEGKIVQCGNLLSVPSRYILIDLSDYNLLPGLVDTHSHLGLISFVDDIKTSDFNEYNQALTSMADIRDSLNFWASATLEVAVSASVTTMAVLPGSLNMIGGIGTVLKTEGKDIKTNAHT